MRTILVGFTGSMISVSEASEGWEPQHQICMKGNLEEIMLHQAGLDAGRRAVTACVVRTRDDCNSTQAHLNRSTTTFFSRPPKKTVSNSSPERRIPVVKGTSAGFCSNFKIAARVSLEFRSALNALGSGAEDAQVFAPHLLPRSLGICIASKETSICIRKII